MKASRPSRPFPDTYAPLQQHNGSEVGLLHLLFTCSLPYAVTAVCTAVYLVCLYSYAPPALLATLQICVYPCVFSSLLLSCFYFFYFFSLSCLFLFRFGRRCVSSCLFLVGIMLSPSFLLRLVKRTYHVYLIRTHADLTFFFCLTCTIRLSYCVYYILFFFLLR